MFPIQNYLCNLVGLDLRWGRLVMWHSLLTRYGSFLCFSNSSPIRLSFLRIYRRRIKNTIKSLNSQTNIELKIRASNRANSLLSQWLARLAVTFAATVTVAVSLSTSPANGAAQQPRFHSPTFSAFFFFFFGSSVFTGLLAPRFPSTSSSTGLAAGRFLKIVRQTEAHRATISSSPLHAARRIIHGGINSGFKPTSTPNSERSHSRPLVNNSFRRLVSSLSC